MRRYMIFNIEKFIEDSKGWDDMILSLQKELSAICELKGREQSPTYSTNISDPTFSTAADHEAIQREIDKIVAYKAALRYAMSRLSEPQKEAIELFFYSKGNKGRLVHEYGRKYALNTRLVYVTRREALATMRLAIEEKYEL